MTDDLNRLRAVAEAATPGPWDTEYEVVTGGTEQPDPCWLITSEAAKFGYIGEFFSENNANFIAMFDPPTVLALLDRAERDETERDELRGRCICNTGPNTDGPDETCPVHGREYGYWVDEVVSAQQREWATRSDLAALRAAVTNLADQWEESARTAAKRAATVSFDRRQHYADLSEDYEFFASRVRSLLAAAPTETEETPDE